MHEPIDDPITVPAEPVPGAGSPFPIVASLAPVVASVVIFSFTRSPFVLAFAALGPVVAIAGVVDNRWSIRRRLKADTREYEAEVARITALVSERHASERRSRRAAGGGARFVLDAADVQSGAAGFGRWRAPADRRTMVVVGYGEQPSGVRVDGPPGGDTARVKQLAARVSDVPVGIDASGGIGVVGPAVLTRAFARGLLVQLCTATGPDSLAVIEVPEGWDWTRPLPHRSTRAAGTRVCVIERSAATGPLGAHDPAAVLLVLADRLDLIPTRCSHLVEFTGVTTVLLHRATSAGLPDTTEFSSTWCPRRRRAGSRRNSPTMPATPAPGRPVTPCLCRSGSTRCPPTLRRRHLPLHCQR